MSLRVAAEALVVRAADAGRTGRVLKEDEIRSLRIALPLYPDWLAELLALVPLCGLELQWQAYVADPTFDGLEWLEWHDAAGVLSESVDCYPGLAIVSAGYVNVGGDIGGGNPYFINVNEGPDPPLYQIYHDVGSEADVILREGRRIVSATLSEFFRTAIVE